LRKSDDNPVSVIEAHDLAVGARIDGTFMPVLRELSFRLSPGRILGLVGESGAGKSMVGRAIAQLLPPGFAITGGALTFEGQDLPGMAPRQRRALLGRAIAFIPQAPLTALNPVVTIGRQFGEHLARQGIRTRRQRREGALAMLSAAQLSNASELLNAYPHQLSGGMCQRVLIAMAFASHPRLVVADEPTTALDATIQARIVALIAQMQQRHGTALIFITHDLRLAASLCDEIMVMYAGRAIEHGPARAVLSAPAHPYTRCLALANPAMSSRRRSLYLLPEQMPSLRQLREISGCHFAPRCPIASKECRHADPPSIEVGAGHLAACIRPEVTSQITAPIGMPSSATVAVPARAVLAVEILCKRYTVASAIFGSRTEITAVRNVDFSIAESEFVGLVGESGSGKSTIARLLLGLERPSAGRILLNGQDVTIGSAQSRKLRVATIQMVFQDPQSALNPRRRVASIVTQAMEAGNRHATWEERLQRANALLAEMGLSPDFATRFPAQLSGGQRQRINIARALCNVPRVLVADEIVSGLDVSIQAQLLKLLVRLRSELGFAMLFISHDLSVVRHLCSRVLVMYRGEIVEQGPIDSIFADPQHPHTRALLAAVPPDAAAPPPLL
jgi:peptide/nickel transport system ATP-binding protein